LTFEGFSTTFSISAVTVSPPSAIWAVFVESARTFVSFPRASTYRNRGSPTVVSAGWRPSWCRFLSWEGRSRPPVRLRVERP
jgi:hypothetical protein